jgi:tetratricopeptide (TPR) repeat protein
MFKKQLDRLKSTLNNNISTCYCHLGDFKSADRFNNLALMEDPEYAKAFYRKALILEGQAKYREAAEVAGWGIKRFDNEFEEEESRNMVQKFR